MYFVVILSKDQKIVTHGDGGQWFKKTGEYGVEEGDPYYNGVRIDLILPVVNEQ
jgi:hypothetical protein